jgi:glucose dehydrogenase
MPSRKRVSSPHCLASPPNSKSGQTPPLAYPHARTNLCNETAESVICLDAETGKRVWHFQTVHHGLWDYDNPNLFPLSPPYEYQGAQVNDFVDFMPQIRALAVEAVKGFPLGPLFTRPR